MAKTKYNSAINGGSKYEDRYKLLLDAIGKEYEYQKKYILHDSFRFEGVLNRAITFTPDFIFKDVCVETKGFIDQKYPIKKKMFLKKFEKNIIEITEPRKWLGNAVGSEFLELKKVDKIYKLKKKMYGKQRISLDQVNEIIEKCGGFKYCAEYGIYL